MSGLAMIGVQPQAGLDVFEGFGAMIAPGSRSARREAGEFESRRGSLLNIPARFPQYRLGFFITAQVSQDKAELEVRFAGARVWVVPCEPLGCLPGERLREVGAA
ncbi:MAG: hypothetical protein AAF368_12390, partial [Planctomycetota bacterium]